MGILQFARVGNYKRFHQNLKEVAKTYHKSVWLLWCDMALSTLRYQSGLTDYLNYQFYLKKHKEKKEYVTIGVSDQFYNKVANIKYSPFFSNKPNFLKNFEKYIDRDWVTPEMGLEALKTFLNTHDSFIEKPVLGLGGGNVSKRKRDEITDIEAYHEKLKQENMFVEEVIIQHEAMANLARNSVNTIRVMTCGIGGKSHILYAALRVGNGVNCADNFHQNGMGVAIDMDSGKLIGNAIDKDLHEFTHHPVSGVLFDGYQIPYWDKIKQICLEAALVNQDVNVIGWDVALTECGPTFIEGNRGPGFDLVQMLDKRGRKDMVREVLKEVEESKRMSHES